ncbi:ROK family transcriptional regulator [Kribbella pittospori]|uniref:ROK family transcriptional regulator n=1 Tax=Kribbella pittospori TaxID=722689 RepID=A0A4R0KUD9_9ACTN|nr:ROK family transcriptional regulator [Kribbella pittospori]TCC61918.1 ROK family transcriptional regulator [Kribbella pittospori]
MDEVLDTNPMSSPSSAAILAAIRDTGGVSRADLATSTGLSKAIVSERVRWLVGSGLVEETGANASTGGRRGTALSLSRSRGVVVGAEIAMTHLQVTVFSLAHELLWEERVTVSMRQGPEPVLNALERAVEKGLTATKAHHPLCGIGVGIAGPVEFETGRTIHPPVHPDWHDQQVRDRLQERFGVPARIDNEVNLMALAEQMVGQGQQVRDLLVIKLGAWVGAGLVSNGKLHRGAQGSAGSLVTTQGGDHIAEQAELLATSGRSAMLAKASTAGQEISARLVVECAQLGDTACRELLDKAAENIGQVLSVVVDFFNPATIVVAGRMAGDNDFLARIRETIYGRSLALATRDLQIVPSALGPESASLGAAIMIIDEITSAGLLTRTARRLSEAPAR